MPTDKVKQNLIQFQKSKLNLFSHTHTHMNTISIYFSQKIISPKDAFSSIQAKLLHTYFINMSSKAHYDSDRKKKFPP